MVRTHEVPVGAQSPSRSVLVQFADECASQLMSTVYEAMHVMNIPRGPWKSGKWWLEMKESMDKHFQRNSHENPLFKTIEDMPIWGGAHPPALVAVLPGVQEHSKKDKTGNAGRNLRVLRARCANACMMGAYLQGLSDAQPLGEMMLALVAPVWTAATKDTEGLKFAPLRRIGRSTAPICYPT